MTVTYDGDTYNVTNLAAEKVDALLDEIYSGEPAESYTLNMDGLEEQLRGRRKTARPNGIKRPKTVPSTATTRKRRFCVRRGREWVCH